jgi:small multidrug resistance family-3 protein
LWALINCGPIAAGRQDCVGIVALVVDRCEAWWREHVSPSPAAHRSARLSWLPNAYLTCRYAEVMTVARSVLLFVMAALLEIGGAWLVWQGWREHRGLWWVAAGVLALGAYGFVATFQSDPNFGRILAAYGGVFVAGSLAWGMIVDKFRPDRYDVLGAAICLAGVAVIMYAPRP